MKIVNKYILNQYPLVFFLCFSLFTFIFSLEKFFKLIELIVKERIIFFSILIFLYSLPSVIALTIPTSLLMSSMIIFGKLKDNNELFIMIQAGVRPISFIKFFLVIGIICVIFNFLFNECLLPYTNFKTKEFLQRIRVKNPLVLLDEGKFFKIKDIEIFVKKVLSKKNMVKNISIHRLLNPEIFIFAKQGKLYLEDKKIIFDLFDGFIHKPLLNAPEKYYVIKFKTYKLIQNFDEESRKRNVIKGIRELNFLELLNSMKKYKELDINTSSIKFELSKRVALCISNLVFIFLGSILAIVGLKRTTKGLAFGITVLIIIVYYLLLVFSQIIGERGLLNPIFCGFIPNIFLLFPIILLLPKFFRL